MRRMTAMLERGGGRPLWRSACARRRSRTSLASGRGTPRRRRQPQRAAAVAAADVAAAVAAAWAWSARSPRTPTTLTVEYMGGGQNPTPVKLVYKLDGSESKNTMPGRGGGAATEVIEGEVGRQQAGDHDTKGANGDTVRALSMDGGKLTVETTAPGRQGGDPTTTKATYTKG